MERRNFIKTTVSASIAATMPLPLLSNQKIEKEMRKFKLCLNAGIIGVEANLQEALNYAIQYGYEAIVSSPKELLSYSNLQINELKDKMATNNISWGSTNLPVEFRQSKTRFNDDFKGLREQCEALEKVGATRMSTWIISTHEELTYSENMRQHAYRLGECAKVMKDYGIRFGLEYLGMRTMMMDARYPFIGSMKEGKELIAEIGESNVGFVLDSYHWHTANDTADDIRTLSPNDIITVDLNDAKAGVDRKALLDGKRELPLATGVINLQEFLQAIIDIGYDGPIRTEPFNQVLNDMDNDDALKLNMQALKNTLATVGM